MMSAAPLAYHRILLKLSGEGLGGKLGFGIDSETLVYIAQQIKEAHLLGCQIGIVVGGGNIFRGMKAATEGMDRTTADYMGMLGTILNALALQDALERQAVPTRVLSAIEVRELADFYIRRKATRHLEKGRVVIFAGGTGNPYFTTDTTSALRAMEMNAQILLKATKVDGIYSEDPEKKPSAIKFEELSYLDVLQKGLKIMDSTAISLCMDHRLPIVVFNFKKPGVLAKIILGEKIGTLVKEDK